MKKLRHVRHENLPRVPRPIGGLGSLISLDSKSLLFLWSPHVPAAIWCLEKNLFLLTLCMWHLNNKKETWIQSCNIAFLFCVGVGKEAGDYISMILKHQVWIQILQINHPVVHCFVRRNEVKNPEWLNDREIGLSYNSSTQIWYFWVKKKWYY